LSDIRARFASSRTLLAGAGLILLALAPLALSQSTAKSSTPELASAAERGKYLVSILACDDCHTPLKWGPSGPEPDMAKHLNGHPEGMTMGPPPALTGNWLWAGAATNTAFAGPWGITYAINLTPDENTGIGIWTEKMFVDALRTGKHMGASRTIMPPMPWPAYRNLTDPDLKAIYAYLRTLKPVKNRVPDYLEPKGPPAAPSSAK
jgi:mono/diheme cytochrome c family protein